jgi:hypothetical protein
MKGLTPAVRWVYILFLVGLVFLLIEWNGKMLFPELARQVALMRVCAFVSAVLIPYASVLALADLVLRRHDRRNLETLLACHLGGLAVLPLILSVYFYTYFIVKQTIALAVPIDILPKLVDNTQTFPTEEKRRLQAKWAYRLYGVHLVYRLDSGQFVPYAHSPEDERERAENRETWSTTNKMTSSINGVIGQIPFLFGLYAATFLTAYTVGGVWLVLRLRFRPPDPLTEPYSRIDANAPTLSA